MYESYLFTLIMPAAVLTYIDADLGPDDRYAWISICWNLGAAVIVTVGGRLADIAGRRWFLLFGAIAGAIGALVGATGQSITQMIFSGIIFGIGGGFQEMCFSCAMELVPNKHRFRTLGKSPVLRSLETRSLSGRFHDSCEPLQLSRTYPRLCIHCIHQTHVAVMLLVVLLLGGALSRHALHLLSSADI
jgi:hypothetical protein